MRTTFESGSWVEHIPVQELKGKHKRDLARVGKPEPVFTAGGEFDQQATIGSIDAVGWAAAKRDATWAMIITGWSYDLPLPLFDRHAGEVTGADAYGELPIDDFEALEALMAPFEEKLNRSPDPKAATTSSSNGSSRANGARSSRKG